MTRLGLIGAGAIAQTYVEAVERVDDMAITAICDTNARIRESAAERLGCTAYASADDMLQSEELDGIVVTTPPLHHLCIAKAALERGVPVLCEKPLTVDSTAAVEMIASAQASGVALAMASKFRYVADIVKARALIDSGIVGEIMLVENLFAAPVDMSARWNSDAGISGGGVLIDNGTHSVEIIRYLAGPIRRVRAVTETFKAGLPVEDTAILFAECDSGARGHAEVSWTLAKKSPNFVTVYGSKGVIEIGWQESRYKRDTDPDWTVFGKGYDKIGAFKANIEDFRTAIAGGAMRTTIADALASVRVIEAAYASANGDSWRDVSGEPGLKAVTDSGKTMRGK
ncbi:MAG: Gfo/Idh/MocA family oxidoreductase [Rhodobiaceae bacterium]|nr:Gfo/Idh/MocA family oxidoreductase [Rhodobiaceae bacterium]MCC0052973.1 Gfo/Idh/MocA family oxidoreductase [Rhodobiaceae bacterium]